MMPEMFATLDAAQYEVASNAIANAPKNIEAFGGNVTYSRWPVDAAQWVGVNGNGFDTVDTMWTAITIGKQAVGNGAPLDVALDRIGLTLVIRSKTMLADTQRSAAALSANGYMQHVGYVRCLTPPSCVRCVILAGKPSGEVAFERHPNCDCTAVFAPDAPADAYTSPFDYLNDLDDTELTRVLGSRANVQAYQMGADLNQLINAYRRKGSVSKAQVYDRTIKYTTEGTTKRGSASRRMIDAGYAKDFVKHGGRYTRVDRPRLMPETIFDICGSDDDKARRMLRDYGWIL